jgi:Ca-activated chloride channel family protein
VQIGDGTLAEIQDGFDLFGQPHYVKTQSAVNPELLQRIAQQTGGEMYVATDVKALQASFHSVLDKLEKSKSEATIATFEDLYRFLLLPGVLLIALEALLRSFVLRRFP